MLLHISQLHTESMVRKNKTWGTLHLVFLFIISVVILNTNEV